MTRPLVIVLRPEPGNAATVALADRAGLRTIAAPLMVIEPLAWDLPDPQRFDAVLLGSANAVRHGGARLAAFRRLPVYAVGEATAGVARNAGFQVAVAGDDNLQSLLAAARSEGHRRLLRVAGEERAPLVAPDGLTIETVTVYAARPIPLAPEAVEALRGGAVALLHSAAAARTFAEACDDAGLARERIALACLSQRIADAGGSGWAAVAVPPAPDDPSLLALAQAMCESMRFGGTDHSD